MFLVSITRGSGKRCAMMQRCFSTEGGIGGKNIKVEIGFL
jgi:hypothetical protein